MSSGCRCGFVGVNVHARVSGCVRGVHIYIYMCVCVRVCVCVCVLLACVFVFVFLRVLCVSVRCCVAYRHSSWKPRRIRSDVARRISRTYKPLKLAQN